MYKSGIKFELITIGFTPLLNAHDMFDKMSLRGDKKKTLCNRLSWEHVSDVHVEQSESVTI